MQSAWKNAKYVDILYSYTCMIIIFLCTKHKGQCGVSNLIIRILRIGIFIITIFFFLNLFIVI